MCALQISTKWYKTMAPKQKRGKPRKPITIAAEESAGAGGLKRSGSSSSSGSTPSGTPSSSLKLKQNRLEDCAKMTVQPKKIFHKPKKAAEALSSTSRSTAKSKFHDDEDEASDDDEDDSSMSSKDTEKSGEDNETEKEEQEEVIADEKSIPVITKDFLRTQIELYDNILPFDSISTLVPRLFFNGDFETLTKVVAPPHNQKKKATNVKIVQSRSRNAYTKSLLKVVRRSNIRVLYKDDDNHWIEGSEDNREDLTNAMVSHYATALTMMACRNINEPTIRRDIMRIMNRPSTDVKSSGENTSKPAAKKLRKK